ncbi:MAG: hypothetical protein LBG43_01110 [Treponema sp.]|jgi:hypothetical protein|nr:hypothetical protein [Treponema sp.]
MLIGVLLGCPTPDNPNKTMTPDPETEVLPALRAGEMVATITKNARNGDDLDATITKWRE